MTTRILIVEDEFTSRKILGHILGAYGDVDIAVDGSEALGAINGAQVAQEPYDVVFLDLTMPGLSGHEVLQEIRAAERARKVPASEVLKVVMTTASDAKEDILMAFRAQVEAYLTKPVERAKVQATLASLGYAKLKNTNRTSPLPA